MNDDIIHALDEDRQNESKYTYPYPESEHDERKAVPIKDNGNVKGSGIDLPKTEYDENGNEIVVTKKKKDGNKTAFCFGYSCGYCSRRNRIIPFKTL